MTPPPSATMRATSVPTLDIAPATNHRDPHPPSQQDSFEKVLTDKTSDHAADEANAEARADHVIDTTHAAEQSNQDAATKGTATNETPAETGADSMVEESIVDAGSVGSTVDGLAELVRPAALIQANTAATQTAAAPADQIDAPAAAQATGPVTEGTVTIASAVTGQPLASAVASTTPSLTPTASAEQLAGTPDSHDEIVVPGNTSDPATLPDLGAEPGPATSTYVTQGQAPSAITTGAEAVIDEQPQPTGLAVTQLNSGDTSSGTGSAPHDEAQPPASTNTSSVTGPTPAQASTTPVSASSAIHASANATPAPAAQVATRIAEEVDRINASITPRVQRLTMRLSPEGLGDVTLTIRTGDQGMSVSVRSASAIDGSEIQRLIEGLTTKPVSVSSSTTSGDQTGTGTGNDQRNNQQAQQQSQHGNENRSAQAWTPASAGTTTNRTATDGSTTSPLPANDEAPTSRRTSSVDVRM